MIARRLAAALVAAGIAVTAAACTSSGGKPHGSRSSGQADVAGRLQQAVDGIHTAQVSLDASVLGQSVAGSGPAQFTAGQLSGLDVAATIPAIGKLRILLTGGKVYAQLPASLTGSTKPWVLLSETSTNPLLSQVAGIVDEVRTAATLTNLVILVKAARSITDKGSDTVQGTPATHYNFMIDPSKLPSSFPDRTDLAGSLKDKPTDLWLDASGRPVQIKRAFLVLGQSTNVTIGAKDFNVPVTISAPPPADVSTG